VNLSSTLLQRVLQADADGATDIKDLSKLYESLLKKEDSSQNVFQGPVGAAIGSR